MKEELLDDVFLKKTEFLSPELTRWERLGSMVLDQFILSFIIAIIPVTLSIINDEDFFLDYFFPVAFFFYLSKDTIKSRSVAKRVTGQIVIDVNTGLPASAFKCMIRNFTAPLYIIEIIIILFIPQKRLGDLIAGTEVVRTHKARWTSIFNDFGEMNKFKLIITVLACIIFYFGFFYLIFNFI